MQTRFLDYYGVVKSKNLNLFQYVNSFVAGQYSFPLKKTLEHLTKIDHALDWGCGNGHWSALVHHFYKSKVSGYSFSYPTPELDPSFFYHTVADTNEPVHIPYKDAEFDAVFSIGVLEHVHEYKGDQVLSLKEIHRLLRPDGMFLCFHLPNKLSWVESLAKFIMLFKKTRFLPHSKKFSGHDVEVLCAQSGFELIEQGIYNFLPRNFFKRMQDQDNQKLFRFLDLVDTVLSKIFFPFCNQRYFIARKRSS